MHINLRRWIFIACIEIYMSQINTCCKHAPWFFACRYPLPVIIRPKYAWIIIIQVLVERIGIRMNPFLQEDYSLFVNFLSFKKQFFVNLCKRLIRGLRVKLIACDANPFWKTIKKFFVGSFCSFPWSLSWASTIYEGLDRKKRPATSFSCIKSLPNMI